MSFHRNDGKELCNTLKKARKELAKANGIDFHTEECSFNGACGGTCPKCDEELRFLMDQLEKIESEKRVYPELIIDEKFVSGHGNMKKRKQSDEPIGIMGYLIPMPKKDEENPIVIPEFLRRDKNE